MSRVGAILGIAVRHKARQPLREVAACRVAAGGGLDGDHVDSKRRGVTFISSTQWQQVTRELGADLPWHMRRANVLVDCDRLDHLIGQTIRVGEVTVLIHAETKPCAVMDEMHPGLQAVLRPDCRAGVYGEVLEGGAIAVGDAVVTED